MLVSGGLFVLFVGLFLAVFSDNRLSLFLGIAMAVTGALMAIPQMVAAAVCAAERARVPPGLGGPRR